MAISANLSEYDRVGGSKVALRVSVETLSIAWLFATELQRASQLGRVGCVANRIASNRIKRSDIARRSSSSRRKPPKSRPESSSARERGDVKHRVGFIPPSHK